MKGQQKQDWIKVKHTAVDQSLQGQLNSIEFKDHGSHIVFIPSLNLSAYGDSQEEAHAMMKDIVLKDFCDTLMHQSFEKIISDLKELGWSQSPFFKKELSKTAYVDKQGLLKDLNVSEHTEIIERLVTV
ncbi:MAG: hypothetical protein REI78_02045 [Pedobacter sp.]|nr:hypothetical protein [Pedobacter sp.]MDQ8051773.1 hypothetical protein [Pedobacter sp.]